MQTEVPQAVYNAAVQKWVSSEPHVEVRVKIGAVLCSNVRQVTPCVVRSLDVLLSSLFEHGCTSGCLQETKVRHALAKGLQHSEQLGSWPMVDALKSLVTHVGCVCSMIRAYVRETIGSGIAGNRFPQIGGIQAQDGCARFRHHRSLRAGTEHRRRRRGG